MADPSEEVAPLLVNAPAPAGFAAPPSYAPYPPGPPSLYAPNYTTGAPFGAPPPMSSFPPSSSAPPPFHYPPPQTPNAEGNYEVSCRVCARPVQYSAAKRMSAVKCTNCNHATQVGPPPAGKNFILCQCNSLLTVPITAKAATCPKQDCKRTLILAPEDPGKNRAFCTHCNTLLTYRSTSAVVICPKCRGRSVVSRSKLHWYIGFNVLIGILFLFLGFFFTLGSYEMSNGIYFVFWGFGVAGVLALIRAIIYATLNWRARDATIIPV